MFKLLIVFNKCLWKSEEEKLAELKRWFAPKVNLDIEVIYTAHENIPFVHYGQEEKDGVAPAWFSTYITPLANAIGKSKKDAVMLVMETSQWKGRGARGWRVDGSPIEMQIAANENEGLYVNNAFVGSTFFNYARHEILHALFSYTGQTDTTHYWWDRWQLENALAEIDFRFRDSVLISQLYNVIRALTLLITRLTQRVHELETEKKVIEKPSRIVEWANAIKYAEGFFVGSRSYRNSNPGNLKSSPYEIGKDSAGFSIFRNYQEGFNALIYQLQLATHTAPNNKISKYYNPEMSLWKFVQIYAPQNDDNDPDIYATNLANTLRVSVDIKIRELA